MKDAPSSEKPERKRPDPGRDLSQRRQPQNGRHDHFTNAGACRLVRCLPMHSEYKESPSATSRGFQGSEKKHPI